MVVPVGAASAAPQKEGNTFKETDGGRRRFLLELEFIQLLANPTYIHYLAQNRYFDDPAFVNYLEYLQYWKEPGYVKFIMYPHALFFLDLLQSANFRAAMAHPAHKELAHRQQFYLWQHYRNNRLKLLQERCRRPPTEAVGEERPSQLVFASIGLAEVTPKHAESKEKEKDSSPEHVAVISKKRKL